MAGTFDPSSPVTLASIGATYGWTPAFMQSHPELWKIIQQAITPTTHTERITRANQNGPGLPPRAGVRPGGKVEVANPPTTLAEFNEMLKGTQWYTQGMAALNVKDTSQQAQAIAAENDKGTTGAPGAAAGGFNPDAVTGAASPFTNLNYTWGQDPAAFAAAKVWTDTPGPKTVKTRGGLVPANGPTQVGAAQYMEDFFSAKKAAVVKLQTSLLGLGLLHPGFQSGIFDDNTQSALKEALYNVYQYNDPNVTIDSYLGRGYVAQTSPESLSKTSTHQTYTSAADAEGQYQQVAQQLLGHRASQSAAEAAYAALHGAEAANPLTDRTTTRYDPATGQAVNSNTVTSGGLGAAGSNDILARQAESAPDFGTYQAATTYYNAMVAHLAASSGVGL